MSDILLLTFEEVTILISANAGGKYSGRDSLRKMPLLVPGEMGVANRPRGPPSFVEASKSDIEDKLYLTFVNWSFQPILANGVRITPLVSS